MNSRSISYSIVENQPLSSWNDEGFVLKGPFAGAANMSHQHSLTDYAEELVSSYAKYKDDNYTLSLDALPDDEQNELARRYIESIGREIEWACYGLDESINSDYLCAMLAMLKNDCEETRKNFADVTRKNILAYYKNILQEILDNACNDYYRNQMIEAGYRAGYDNDHGDVVWGKY